MECPVGERPGSIGFPGLERAGQDSVELIGDFHAQGEELVVEIARLVEVELMAFRGMPEDVVLGVHEVEVDDGEAVVAVDPDGQEGLGTGAFGTDGGRGELDLFVGHALDGDLAGGTSADRGSDDQSVGADRDRAVAGRLGARPGLGLALESLERFFPELVELTLEEAERVRDRPVATRSFPCRTRRAPRRAPPG